MNPVKPIPYETTFPPAIAIPQELILLRAWLMEHGYPISGYFELRADDYDVMGAWFDRKPVAQRLAMFGAGPDGSPYSLWVQDDGRISVVHMGSEGTNNCVLTTNFVQFLRLLAVGYDEIGFDDLAAPPPEDCVNPAFQDWVRRTFSVEIPETGLEITDAARNNCQDFQAWMIQHTTGSAS